ncbi:MULTISPECIES: DUF1206 domain-containing protein [unclassified Methylobacterium]|jgi:hypothetical protein|uniref:DUF1206 domain-containing protein n=1 Tax=unclassified Methylobacterium TaxID=2615210 RepID=UPI0008A7C368|nr:MULTISPECIES: DUF1206 domain-containing protein [unclassified Methylobacterium]SEH98885.1 protein of unknown function [Methylobacterium sp. 275MFSha3.1]SFE82723.1 protein of unknown function [Methylobacterium sp. 13MFTsu3.1M2]
MRTLPGGRNAIERIARFGYGARGVVYIVVGALALLAALGHGGRAGDSKDALRAVMAGPFGAAVVGLIALGLAGFALWRLVEGITDADRRGTSAKGLAVRGAHLISAGLYLGLAASAASLSLGLGMSGGDGVHDGTAWLLSKPFGRWLVALVGLAVVGGGFGFLGKAWRGDVTDRLALDARARDRWAGPIGRFGYAARGLAFLIIGGFLVAAAWHQRSSDAKGLAEAFALLRAQPYGWILLGLVAAGHAAFGAFGLIQARYRHIDAPDIDRVDDAAGAAARALG